MKNRNYLLTGFCLLLSTQTVFAEKHERVQHGSHEHGVARLTVATTDDGVEIALESPAANLFGFEHKAKTAEERELVHEVIEKLEAGSNLFSMNAAAACSFDNAVVESAMDDGHDDHKDEKHDDHKDEKHSDKKHDDHDDHKSEKHEDHHDDKDDKDDKDDDHDDEEKSHSDVDVTWTFDCKKPAAIESVSTTLFTAFPNGFEELAVEWITASGAGKTELKKDDTITLK